MELCVFQNAANLSVLAALTATPLPALESPPPKMAPTMSLPMAHAPLHRARSSETLAKSAMPLLAPRATKLVLQDSTIISMVSCV